MEAIRITMRKDGYDTYLEAWWPADTLHQDRTGANAVEPLRVEWYDGSGNRLDGPPPGWSAEPWKDHELPESFHEVRPGVIRAMLDAPEDLKEKWRSEGIDI